MTQTPSALADGTSRLVTASFTESYALAMPESEPKPTPRYMAILAAANDLARSMNHAHVGVEHLFLAIIRDSHAVPTQVLATAVDPGDVEVRLRNLMGSASYMTPTNRLFPGQLPMNDRWRLVPVPSTSLEDRYGSAWLDVLRRIH